MSEEIEGSRLQKTWHMETITAIANNARYTLTFLNDLRQDDQVKDGAAMAVPSLQGAGERKEVMREGHGHIATMDPNLLGHTVDRHMWKTTPMMKVMIALTARIYHGSRIMTRPSRH